MMTSHILRAVQSDLLVDSLASEQIAAEWDQNVPSRAAELESKDDRTFYEIIAPLFSEILDEHRCGESLIDVGCGLGYLSDVVRGHRYRATGIDISKESINYASSKFSHIRFCTSSIAEFASKNCETFETCIANMVLHNLTDLDGALRNIHRMLSKNGVFVFAIPHPTFWFQTRWFAKDYDFRYTEVQVLKIPFRIRGGQTHPSLITYVHRPLSMYYSCLNKYFSVSQIIEPCDFDSPTPVDLLVCICTKRD